MKRLAYIALILAAFGCKKTETPAPTAATTQQTSAENGVGRGGVAPIGSGAVGGISPVSGGESIEGAGMGGIGQAAKSQAMKAAAGASAPNLGQSGDGE